MPRAGVEPPIPVLERPKTVLALDRSAIETGTVISISLYKPSYFYLLKGC
jgi:hypothetical protein